MKDFDIKKIKENILNSSKAEIQKYAIPGTLNLYKDIEKQQHLKFGNYSYYDGTLNLPVYIKKLVIGNFTSIAGGLNFVTYGHPINNISTFPFYALFKEEPNEEQIKIYDEINIGNDVYIGDSVTIVAPCIIGDGAVIATKSVIRGGTKIVPYGVYGGNPAKFIKYRIEEREDRDFLLKNPWWDFPIEEIKEIKDILQSDNIEEYKNYILSKGD